MQNQVVRLAAQVLVMAIVISTVLLFVGMGVLVLIHVCIVGRALRRGFSSDNDNNSMMVESGSHGSTSMSIDDLEKLPCFEFEAKVLKGSSTSTPNPSPVDCAVCLENFMAGERCRLLPLCRHSFHAECVDMWLLRSPICPICRASAHLLVSAAEGSGRRGDTTGNQFSNYVEMASTESAVSETPETRWTEAGNEPGNGQALMGSYQSREPANITRESQISATSNNVNEITVVVPS